MAASSRCKDFLPTPIAITPTKLKSNAIGTRKIRSNLKPAAAKSEFQTPKHTQKSATKASMIFDETLCVLAKHGITNPIAAIKPVSGLPKKIATAFSTSKFYVPKLIQLSKRENASSDHAVKIKTVGKKLPTTRFIRTPPPTLKSTNEFLGEFAQTPPLLVSFRLPSVLRLFSSARRWSRGTS